MQTGDQARTGATFQVTVCFDLREYGNTSFLLEVNVVHICLDTVKSTSVPRFGWGDMKILEVEIPPPGNWWRRVFSKPKDDTTTQTVKAHSWAAAYLDANKTPTRRVSLRTRISLRIQSDKLHIAVLKSKCINWCHVRRSVWWWELSDGLVVISLVPRQSHHVLSLRRFPSNKKQALLNVYACRGFVSCPRLHFVIL